MRYRPLALALCTTLFTPAVTLAADKKSAETPKWDVNAAHGATKTVRFETDEGTWLDLDVSPDGKSIVFSMMGDLYLLPIEGGRARRITSGAAWDVQPRFSPDGKEIAFTSDRGGGNNLWRVDIQGTNATQVSKEDFRLLNNPAWTPDGKYLIGRKHFTGQRSLGAGELWMYHKTGGAGLQLTKQKNDQQDLGEPAVSKDGRYVYFSEDVSDGPYFQYNKNPHDVIYAIKRLDRETGDIETIVRTPGGAVRPQPSPDGKSLAFVKRVRDKSVLHIQDLETGAARPLWDGLSHDMQEAWAVFGPYANYAWTPDSQHIVIWAQGKLWRVDAQSGTPSTIPFKAEIEQRLAAPLRFEQQIESDQFAPKMIRDVTTSPDGKTIVFHALGHLWTKSLPNGKPQRLSNDDGRFEYQPSYSADGRKLLFTTWTDAGQGAIHERDLATGQTRTITTKPGFYYGPKYSRDGKQIVYAKTSGSSLTGNLNAGEGGVYVMSTHGGDARRVAKHGGDPQFSADGKRVFFLTGGGIKKKLQSVAVDGTEMRDVFDLKYVDFVSISPDGQWVAFTELFNAYVAPMPQTGGSIELSKDTRAIPVSAISQDVGSYLHWSANSDSLHWMVGREYHSRALKDSFAFVPGAPKSLPKPGSDKGIDIGLTAKVDTPTDVFAFTGARLITMNDAESKQEVIENGVLVVEGDSIKAIGATGSVSIPANARIIDVAGKTIAPGYVDVHAHANHFSSGVVPQQNWAYYTNLAFGITTSHDPSATSETVFSQAELVKAGAMVGPRIYSTGTILYGADGDFKAVINSFDDARAHLRRMKAHGAFSVKSYNQPRRDQRQQINEAARELGMLVVEEGGSTFNHNMTMMLDGVTSIEHNVPVAPLYRDVIGVWKETDVRNTPTLVVSYGGLSGEYWWYARDNVWEDKKLNRFFPRETLDARSVRRETAPDWDYYHIEVAKAAKKLRDNGIKITVGGHGQLQGISANWEIWSLTQGGFSNWEALRAATIDGADLIGLSKQIGSLTPGKRADFVVLNSNPLDDIRATIDTRYVAVNGRVFDADADMAEVGGKQRKAPTFYWQQHAGSQSFGIEYGPTAPCHCPKSGTIHQH
jgi:Tol biopolymer transport system component/imidazolonepropionase-like amidohydrolase